MTESIIDDLISLQDAVKDELVSQGFADILVDGGRMRIYPAGTDRAVKTVWCEMSIILEGIVQPVRIDIEVDSGRFMLDRAFIVRGFINAIVGETCTLDTRLEERAIIRQGVDLAIAQATENGLAVELTGLQRMPYDVDGYYIVNGWRLDFLMVERDDEGVVFHRAFTVEQQIGVGYGYEGLHERLRNEEFPAQHRLLREKLENKVAGRLAWAATYPMSDRLRAWTPFGFRA